MTNEERILVNTPEVLLDSNLKFPTEEPLIRQLVVTRDRCINPSLVDSFLRLSRNGSDDIIRQKLSSYSRNQSDHGSIFHKRDPCSDFLKNDLFPNWQTRDQVITFCEKQCNDIKNQLDETQEGLNGGDAVPEIDPRLDPYGARKLIYEKEARYKEWKRLHTWVENNREIESILQATTLKILRQTCDQNVDYLDQFFQFLKRK